MQLGPHLSKKTDSRGETHTTLIGLKKAGVKTPYQQKMKGIIIFEFKCQNMLSEIMTGLNIKIQKWKCSRVLAYINQNVFKCLHYTHYNDDFIEGTKLYFAMQQFEAK